MGSYTESFTSDSACETSVLVVLTKNARIGSEDRLAALLSELHGIRWDVIMFSETRMPSQTPILSGGHRLCASGRGHDATGVAVLLHARHVLKQTSISLSDRVLYLDCVLYRQEARVVAAYLPHASLPRMDVNHVHDQLYVACRTRRACIVGGDFPTEITETGRGDDLTDFVVKCSLRFCNASRGWSFKSDMGRLRLIDWDCLDARCRDVLCLDSDHRAVMAQPIPSNKSMCNTYTVNRQICSIQMCRVGAYEATALSCLRACWLPCRRWSTYWKNRANICTQ